VRRACVDPEGFRVTLSDRTELLARKLLLATGVKDRLPFISGVEELYGTSIHHCPYCDGWEWRDQPLAAYGRERHGYALAVALLNWSKDLVLVTDGPTGLTMKQQRELKRLRVPVRSERVVRLEGQGGMLERLVFESGTVLERRALFFSSGQDQCCDLAREFGCNFNRGTVKTGLKGETNVPGLYVVGDASRDVQFVIVAAAEGAKAGVAIHEALREEELSQASD
jgi:thioredoxin reductase